MLQNPRRLVSMLPSTHRRRATVVVSQASFVRTPEVRAPDPARNAAAPPAFPNDPADVRSEPFCSFVNDLIIPFQYFRWINPAVISRRSWRSIRLRAISARVVPNRPYQDQLAFLFPEGLLDFFFSSSSNRSRKRFSELRRMVKVLITPSIVRLCQNRYV